METRNDDGNGDEKLRLEMVTEYEDEKWGREIVLRDRDENGQWEMVLKNGVVKWRREIALRIDDRNLRQEKWLQEVAMRNVDEKWLREMTTRNCNSNWRREMATITGEKKWKREPVTRSGGNNCDEKWRREVAMKSGNKNGQWTGWRRGVDKEIIIETWRLGYNTLEMDSKKQRQRFPEKGRMRNCVGQMAKKNVRRTYGGEKTLWDGWWGANEGNETASQTWWGENSYEGWWPKKW